MTDLNQALLNPSVTVEEITTLIADGADVNATDESGRSALHVICLLYDEDDSKNMTQEDRIEMMRLLLESGANINAQTTHGPNPDEPYEHNKISPLHIAVGLNYAKVVKYLLSMGANPNIQDALKRTPLFAPVHANNQEMVETLLEGGADINCTCIHHYNPSTGEPIPVTFELNGVDGETDEIYPLDLAVMEDHQELSSYLLSVGAEYTPGLTQLEMSIGLKDGVDWGDIFNGEDAKDIDGNKVELSDEYRDYQKEYEEGVGDTKSN